MSWRDLVIADVESPVDDYEGPGGAACRCTICGLDFTSIGPFDEHRTGKVHHRDPAKDTRRCRTPDELRERGLEPNESGQWRHPRPAETIPGKD